MTEDEAKTKWCPFASSRLIQWKTSTETITNQFFAGPTSGAPSTCCIASACMAWREVQKWAAPEVRTTGIPSEDAVLKPHSGFCGLAGAPTT